MGAHVSISRRNFLAASVSFAGAVSFSLAIPTSGTAATSDPVELNSWVVIQPNNRVTVRIPQAEIGQGTTTALAQLVAEELDLDRSLVDWEFYDPQTNRIRNNVYVHTATLASFGIEMLFKPMRTGSAQIRAMLLQAAAAKLGADPATLVVESHEIRTQKGDRKVTFAEIGPAAAQLPVPQQVQLKDPAKWRYIGKPLDRVDAFSKSTGQAKYGIDVVLPGMKYAAVKQSPVFGGKLHSFDADAIKNMPGVVKVVAIKAGPTGYTVPPTLWDIIDWEMDDAVAVVADSWWLANQALEALPITWDEGPNAKVSSASIDADLGAALDKGGMVVRAEGDAKAALEKGKKKISAEYHYPFLEHATMEPMNCTAVVTDLSVEAWAPTQYGDEALRIAAYAAGVALKDAKFHLTLGGGGFGRRLHNDYVNQAVQVARAMKGTPIKLIASREETFRRSYYPPVMTSRFEGAIDERGNAVAWKSHVAQGRSVFQPYGMTRIVLPVPNIEVQYSTIETPPPFAWMRGVGHTQNAWMNHGFMSELAEAAGMDTLAFYQANLDEGRVPASRPDHDDAVARIRRFRRVLDYALAKAGPAAGKRGNGWGRGISVYDMSYIPGFHSSCLATIVEVALDGKGGLSLERVVVAVDCGLAVNPSIVEAQVQSGVIFGLTNAVNGKITLKDGRVEQSNFDSYNILRLAEAPRVDVHIMPSTDQPAGIGEGVVPVVIGGLVDAIFDAGGPRVRRLPVRDNDLRLRKHA